MSPCPKCGIQVGDGIAACPSCGTSTNSALPAPATSTGTSGDLSANVASLLCYAFGVISGIVFLNLDPYRQNQTIRFHAWQSIFLNVSMIALWFALGMVGIIFAIMHLGSFFPLFGMALNLGFLVLWVFLLVKAYNGEKLKLPIIGDWAEKQSARQGV